MNIHQHIKNGLISLRAIPHAKQGQAVEEEGILKIYLTSIPDKNKANVELIKFFKKEFKLKVRIKSGMKSREKVVEIMS